MKLFAAPVKVPYKVPTDGQAFKVVFSPGVQGKCMPLVENLDGKPRHMLATTVDILVFMQIVCLLACLRCCLISWLFSSSS